MSKFLYIFTPKDSTSVYAYTRNKKLANDFYDINSDRLIMMSIDADKYYGHIDSACAIAYFTLTDENGDDYQVPMTISESTAVTNMINEMCIKSSYTYNTLVENNRYGLKNKYLKVISELTKVLNKKEYLQYNHYTAIMAKNNLKINSLKIYQDLCVNNKNDIYNG